MGAGRYDGTALYEHEDPRLGLHADWGTHIFNYGRHEVRSFLLSSAHWWLSEFHFDGLRVDAVASMLYLDYSRKPGEWLPNKHGGRENLDAIEFLKQLNAMVHAEFPGALTIAEESTAWPMVSRPTYVGGLGFSMKWNMGWMNDSLRYFHRDPIYRRWHHNELTFGQVYAYSENYVLPFSHDEVVHGKGSLIGKMPGDAWQRFANLRLLLAWQSLHAGQEADVHGRRVRPAARMVGRPRTRLGLVERSGPCRVAAPVRRPESPLPRPSGAAIRRISRVVDSTGSTATTANIRCSPGCAGGGMAVCHCCGQLHAGATNRLPPRRARRPGAMSKFSTAILLITAAATWAMPAGSTRARMANG
jgi:hypothetical protein